MMLHMLMALYNCRRARRKRNVSDDEEDDDVAESEAGEDSDVEMEDARPSKARKSDVSEGGKQTRAERLSARTQAKVCIRLVFAFGYCFSQCTVGAPFNE